MRTPSFPSISTNSPRATVFPLATRSTNEPGVAWGTTHKEDGGKPVPVLAPDAPPERAKELAARCRDLGLEPLMMFSTIYPEAANALEVLTHRLRQAGAARVPQVLGANCWALLS